MSYLSEWITNIILFILLATVLDLLLPKSSLQKYVKMVTGLLLIVIILTPLLKVFSVDVNEIFNSMKLTDTRQEENMKNLIEMKKKEIQASQGAYILEQMAVQMKSEVEEEMMQKHGLAVDQVVLVPAGDVTEVKDAQDIESIKVIVSKTPQRDETAAIQPVTIDTSKPIPKKDETMNLANAIQLLAEKWETDPDKISVAMEGRGT